MSEVHGDGHFNILRVPDLDNVGQSELLIHRLALLLDDITYPVVHLLASRVLYHLQVLDSPILEQFLGLFLEKLEFFFEIFAFD